MKCISFIVSIRSSLTHSHCFIVHRNHIFRLDQLNESNILLGVLALFVPGVFLVLRTYWAQKIPLEKLSKFIKILNYIKPSCIIFCSKLLIFPIYFLGKGNLIVCCTGPTETNFRQTKTIILISYINIF